MPTIIVLFIMRMGSVLNVGYEKVLLLYNPVTYDVADVVSTYVYRVGLAGAQYSFSTAVSLLNSLVNIVFLTVTNAICNKVNVAAPQSRMKRQQPDCDIPFIYGRTRFALKDNDIHFNQLCKEDAAG